MDMSLLLPAIIATLTGSLCLYLASPNQRWLGHALPKGIAFGCGTVLLLLALGGWLQAFSPVAGLFSFVTLTMFLFGLFPYLSLLKPAGCPHEP